MKGSIGAMGEGMGAFTRWLKDGGNSLLVISGLWVAVASVWFLLGLGTPETRLAMADFGNVPLMGSAAFLAWRASRPGKLDARSRRAWSVIGFAFLATTLGDLVWLIYELVLHADPFPSWADVPYLLYYPCMMIGLLLFPTTVRDRTDRFQFLLDITIVMLGGLTVVWYFIIGPVARGTGAPLLETATLLAYPVGDLALLGGMTSIVLRRWDRRRSGAMITLALATTVYIAADLAWASTTLLDTYASGNWTETLWFLAAFLMAAGAQTQYRTSLREAGPEVAPTAEVRPFSPLPYVAVAISYGLLLYVASNDVAYPLRDLVYGVVAVTALVVARQVFMARENAQLVAESAARRGEARFGSLVRNSSDVITIVDSDFHIVWQSPSVERIFGFSPGALVGTKLSLLFRPDHAPHYLTLLQQAIQQPDEIHRIEWQWFHQDGALRHAETTVNNLLDDPNVQGLVLNTRDITERKALEEQIRHQAFHDTLTNLANRALFRDRVEQALAEQQMRKEPIAVLFLDLDNFKTLNDSLGHSAGDQLLVAVAQRLKDCVRPTDTVARLGGDEFAILLKWTDLLDAMNQASRIIGALQVPFHMAGREIRFSASIGIAGSASGREQVEELLRNADVAMYSAKSSGKGRYEAFHPTMYAAVRERLDMEAEMREGIDGGHFLLYYQPIVVIGTGRISGVEALVRWKHPTRGMLGPGQFIPVAEETGLILPLGQWVLDEACRQVRIWQDRFPSETPLTVSVNLSVKQIYQPGFVDNVAQSIARAGIPPQSLVLEITESILMQSTDALVENLRALRNLGVRLAIDDFGTGYSSLSYLRWFPVDVLKLDKSFVKGIESNPKVVSLVNGIINLAQGLGLQTVAEGIERAEQLPELNAVHCNLGQGYYFSRPTDAEGIERLWESLSAHSGDLQGVLGGMPQPLLLPSAGD